jgi:hypothetical protein
MTTPAAWDAGVAGDALQSAGGVDEASHLRGSLIFLPKCGDLLQGAVDGHAWSAGDELGDAVDERVAEVERAPHIAQCGFGCQRAKGDNLGNPLLPVLLAHIANDHIAPCILKVHVDVGHLDALDVQEPLEGQSYSMGSISVMPRQ